MYINDLGIGRTGSVDMGNIAAKTVNTTTVDPKNKSSYATAMKNAVDNQKSSATPTFTTAGDIIIKEAFEKMKTDPEWEESVMDKVKEYYAGDYSYAADSTQKSYLNLLGQNSLQNYLAQSLISGQSMLGLGLSGYPNYGYGALASSAYRNVMNNTLNSSILGSWQL